MAVGSATAPDTSTSTTLGTSPADITLSHHNQWTGVNEGDIGRSGYAVGRGPKQNWFGMDMLTNRRLPPELQQQLDDAEQSGDMGRVRQAQSAVMQAGYTMADMGKEGVVAGGLSGMRWAANPGQLQSWGWSQDPTSGQWRHKSWGKVSMGADQKGDYQSYLTGLDTKSKADADKKAADDAKAAEDAAAKAAEEQAATAVPAVAQPARTAAAITRLQRTPSLGPRRTWAAYKGSSTLT